MIREYVKQLISLPDDAFVNIAFLREPLKSKMTSDVMTEIYLSAEEYGKKTADSIIGKYSESMSLDKIIKDCGGKLHKYQVVPDAEYAMFAYYEHPDIIAINTLAIEMCNQLISNYELSDLIGNVNLSELIVAHEFYHLLEERDENAFPQQKNLKVKSMFGINTMKKVSSLEEIAAMSFAKQITGTKVNPYIFNIVLLEAFYPQKARQAFEIYTQRKE